MLRNLNGKVLSDWEKVLTSNDTPYYINHNLKISQWDHPEYIRLFEEIVSLSSIKYAAYRTAFKLRHLQTRLKFHEISQQNLVSSFDNAGFRNAENLDFIPLKQLSSVIYHLICRTYKYKPVDAELCMDLIINLLLNIYDRTRSGNIHVLSCKILLIVLCGGRLQEKYRYLFSQVSDYNNCVTRHKLAILLRDLTKIPEFLLEQSSFGSKFISPAVDSCFQKVGDVGIHEHHFLAWLLQEPQNLVWLTTLYRLTTAELVCHDVKCSICKQQPIIGMRYQCLKCLSFNMCQDCFLHGRISRGHKVSHPIQEYCQEPGVKEWCTARVKILKNHLGREGRSFHRYLSLPFKLDTSKSLATSLCEESPSYGSSQGSLNNGNTEMGNNLGNVHSNQIFSIRHRQEGHDKQMDPESGLEANINYSKEYKPQVDEESSGKNIGEFHTQKLHVQIEKLKSLCGIHSDKSPLGSSEDEKQLQLESTPMGVDKGLWISLSPIPARDGPANDTAIIDNRENHRVENPLDYFAGQTSIRDGFGEGCNSELGLQRVGTIPFASSASGLPSFTEIHSSDISSMASGNSYDQKDDKSWQDSNLSCQALAEVKAELKLIIQDLDSIFPMFDEPCIFLKNRSVIDAVEEIGDVLGNYVQALPQPNSSVLVSSAV